MAKQFILTPRVEEILRAVHFYRYMTALDITHLSFSPKSITHVREILNKLCGGADHAESQYLFRFPLPEFTGGKTEKVYTLGSKGRDLLSTDLKIPVDWYFRPAHTKQLSHGLIIHNLTLTRFLVCSNAFCKMHTSYAISDLKISYQMEKEKAFKIVPDAWILFKKGNKNFPILLEIDRGTAYKERLKEHIKSRIEFLRSGDYQTLFQSQGCLIVYATTGEIEKYRESRLNFMRECCREVLDEMNLKRWSSIFRLGAVVRREMFASSPLGSSVWVMPDNDSPLALLTV